IFAFGLAQPISELASTATLELGLFAAPVQFDFEAGVVYRRGCEFALEVRAKDREQPLEVIRFRQTIDATNQKEVLAPSEPGRVPHFGWRPPNSRPLDPPILLRLAPEVLSNQDDVRVCFQLRPTTNLEASSKPLDAIPGQLRVIGLRGGKVYLETPITVRPRLEQVTLAVSGWPTGSYRIEVIPEVPGTTDRDGPYITYRRSDPTPSTVALSPVAPWTFDRDPARSELTIDNFEQAVARWSTGLPKDTSWTFHEAQPGRKSLVNAKGDWREAPVVLRPGLKGSYAVFAETEKGFGYVQLGKNGIIRAMREEPAFVEAADLTDAEITFHPVALAGAGLRRLRFVPVTASSVETTLRAVARPPLSLRGIADWAVYFFPPPWHASGGGRLEPDQLAAILKGHAEIGFTSIDWSIGRSWVEYESRLPNTSRFPVVPLASTTPETERSYSGRAHMINSLDPYSFVLEHGRKEGVEIIAWLTMQNHYGDAYGGIFSSRWFNAHPDWHRWYKGAKRANDKSVSYYFPEVRSERVDILCEVAERSPDGVLVDWCRQTPIILYDPKMVAEYRAKTGVDPLRIDANHQPEYNHWIRWRAEFVTEVLRELRQRLERQTKPGARRIPVSVRVPSKGIFYNLAQGLDLETWCREKLIDQIQVDPLEESNWRGEPHDVRPYVELGRKYQLPIFGGLNGNTLFWNHPAILRRALGLIDAGVDGIEMYESSKFAYISPERWLIPLLGHRGRLREFLETSNLEACHPILSRNACAGYDNHSFRTDWSIYGLGPSSL
ncbi:MAG: family 10 glycosylhydrolase, partial [Verrucomicrobiota bacterium]